jgi:hypothetical protein
VIASKDKAVLLHPKKVTFQLIAWSTEQLAVPIICGQIEWKYVVKMFWEQRF